MAETIKVGDRFQGVTGNVMEVVELDGDRVRLEYIHDREDGEGEWWETITDVLNAFGEA